MHFSTPSPRTWPLWALILSAAMLAGAHAFEHIGRLLPCPLCLRQREVYWAAITVAAIGYGLIRFWPSDRLKITVNMMLCLVFLTGAVIAGYHTGVEWSWWDGPQSCSGPSTPTMSENFTGLNLDRKFATVSCDKPAWTMFGISMAGYNTLISVGLAAISGQFALRALSSAPLPDEAEAI
ncbi:MAG: disulfide bond formation protein B [Ponticaulis sp.]|nr:disulfide bond formation protein B [Ponticaulis sp.]|tara:strand:- start:77781 stop:78320 length:540 start_codon:yes stop_codon:yes gene_type:complete